MPNTHPVYVPRTDQMSSKRFEEGGSINQLGTGLVEISAVATMVGAPIAEALTLGLRSASCLPWASMSAFGLLHVAKAALAAAIPDWFRDSMGLRNDNVVAAIGYSLPLEVHKQHRRHGDLGSVKMISITHRGALPFLPEDEEAATEEPVLGAKASSFALNLVRRCRRSFKSRLFFDSNADTARCFYQIDQTTRLALDTIRPAEPGEEIILHEFIPDQAGQHKRWKDAFALIFSVIKVSEIITLRQVGSHSLHWFTSVGWACGLVWGAILIALNQSRDRVASESVDSITGLLPSALNLGSEGKVLIGLPLNIRRGVVWKAMWYLYSASAMVGIFGTFIVLSRQSAIVIYFWMGFQILWLALRTGAYYFVPSALGARQGLLVGRPWVEAPLDMRFRLLNLAMALARQQATEHPRGAVAYSSDLTDIVRMRVHLQETSWSIENHITLKEADAKLSTLEVVDVIGDPAMRTMAWIAGGHFSNPEIYDSALAFVRLSSRKFSIPCVRVFACNCNKAVRMRYRGDSHGSVCANKIWVLWIPARETEGAEGYVYARGRQTHGTLDAEFVTDAQLNERLAAQQWNISFTRVGDLDPVLSVSRDISSIIAVKLRGLDSANAPPRTTLAVGIYDTGV